MISFGRNNEKDRLEWLRGTLAGVPANLRVLDAGAGELRNRAYCDHLQYVSQDFCQYEGKGDGVALQTGRWDTTRIDLVSDISNIPAPDASFDVVLCTEVFEHLPDATAALREFARLLKADGTLITTAPFCSLTHFAPFHFATGFSRYWYESHLQALGFVIVEMKPNGGWLDYVAQELWRLPSIGTSYSSKVLGWLALSLSLPALAIMRIMKSRDRGSSELLTFGWQVVARK